MSDAVVAAIIGSALTGVVVFLALLVERGLTRRTDQRARRQAIAREAYAGLVRAVHQNVLAIARNDQTGVERTGGDYLVAASELLMLGPPAIGERLLDFDRTGRDTGSDRGQTTFVKLLKAVRDEVLPGETLTLGEAEIRELLFGTDPSG